ncbi:hypothetical protein H5410_006765 [Solanum commersonii]|uniref:Uncharacterized protein n=1 Tax=Solanum commersonii TaxID=4109 RepID=A0A9J6AB79_SOLCO|nr:hypothetical protein H5410_006765 [Solanum commersonii]
MLSISENVGKRFVVSSRSPRRTPLMTPSKSYVVDGGGQGCLGLAIGCHFDTWQIVIGSCI